MNDPGSLLLDLWRAAAGPAGLDEVVERVARRMAGELPLRTLAVHHLDLREACLEVVAAATVAGLDPPELPRTRLASRELEALLEWGHGRADVAAPRDLPAGLGRSLPAAHEADALVAPLLVDGGEVGLLTLIAWPGARFDEGHRELAAVVAAPLAAAFASHLERHRLVTEREAARAEREALLARYGKRDLGDVIVGADGGLREVMEQVEQVGRSDVPVLVFGETGSGKEVVARAIHTRSPRAAGPFLRVNCGAIPSELVDSELFGHEQGSFTGASRLRRGWFERSDGGTLFLDEIAELSPAAQVRLLRVLQDGTFERVGGQRQLRVDVRVVAATHRDLFAMVEGRRFREDLWYRLAVFPIFLPPLRDRLEDLPQLAAHFARRAARHFGLPEIVPDRADIGLLASYRWPGNIRELAAVIDRAAILGDGRRLEIAAALGVSREAANGRNGPPQEPPAPLPRGPGLATFDDAVRQHLERALEATRGRIEGAGGAAELLAVNPHTLRSRMRRLGLDWTRFRR